MNEHHHEEWQLQDHADGGRYCAACGAVVGMEDAGHQVIPVEAVEAAVIQIRPRASETFVCPCGSQWFSLHYRMDVDGRIIERSGVATCDGGCGRKHEVTKK